MPAASINVLLGGERLDGDAFSALSRAEIRESHVDPSLLALRFHLTQDGGEFPLIDQDLFEPVETLAVELAAPGGLPTRLFDGYVTHVRPHFETIPGNCYLEVLAMDAAVLLDGLDRAESYPDATDSDAATQVFDRYGLAHEVSTTPARHKTDRQLLVQRDTDWRFVQKLARRNGFCCYFEYDPARSTVVAHFAPRALDASPQADVVLLQDQSNLTWLDIQAVLTGPVGHRGAAIDPIGKRVLRADGQPAAALLGEAAPGDLVTERLGGISVEEPLGWLRDPVPVDAAIDSEGKAATDTARFLLEARGELDPALYRGLLRARRPVLIKGVGRRFAGAWYVRAVRTVLDEGALTQTFVAERNAWGLTGQEDFGQSAEEVGPE